MSSLKLQSFRLNVTVDVGSLNQKKATALAKSLEWIFPSADIGINNESIMIMHQPSRKFVFIAPRQITYGHDEMTSGVDFDEVQRIVNSVAEPLLIDGPVTSNIQMVAHLASRGSTMAESLKFLSFDHSGLSGLSGVGLRLLFKKEEVAWELKLEPYIRNDSTWFVEAICALTPDLNISAISESAKEAYSIFAGEWSAFAVEQLKGVDGDEGGEEE